MESEATAQHMAEFYLAMASHLADHLDLCPVNAVWPNHLQLRMDTTCTGEELVTWARSLTEPYVQVGRVNDQAYVYVHGKIGDHACTVWNVVDGLADAMEPEAFTGVAESAWISVDALAAYAEDRTIPEPLDPPELHALAGIPS